MKIVSAKEMARVENLAYKAGFSEEGFMDKAGFLVARNVAAYCRKNTLSRKALLICGKGNNAGDAFVCGTNLIAEGFSVVAYHFAPRMHCSPLCQKKAQEFLDKGGKIYEFTDAIPQEWHGFSVIVDGLFGTGFKGQVNDFYRAIIEEVNQLPIPVIAIDIPSGIDGTSGDVGGVAIEADETVFLGFPKTGCILGEALNYVGEPRVENFGLTEEFIDQAHADFILIDEPIAKALLPPIKRTRHKYERGYLVGLGGSPGMPGAPMLATYASLRVGAGIVRLLHPEQMHSELAFAPYELVRQGYEYQDAKTVIDALNKASAVFIGPGIGRHAQIVQLMHEVLPAIQKPCVIDADALDIIASENLNFPKETVITPHQGEMQRLLHIEAKISHKELIPLASQYAQKNNITLVLKGAATCIFSGQDTPLINLRGSPGMATAGSGDVLTGIIAAFAAQKLSLKDAAALGVYVHALAGEYAAAEKTAFSMVAGDIIEMLPQAFKFLM